MWTIDKVVGKIDKCENDLWGSLSNFDKIPQQQEVLSDYRRLDIEQHLKYSLMAASAKTDFMVQMYISQHFLFTNISVKNKRTINIKHALMFWGIACMDFQEV